MKKILSSESVTEGHPDKVCDQISDAILDACLEQDAKSRVAIECLIKSDILVIAGELTTTAKIEYEQIARGVLTRIGYDPKHKILIYVTEQSPDINQGVDQKEGDIGAGDQGMMFGYASNETVELMPLPIILSHKLTRRLAEVRKSGEIDYLGPDGKAQVSVEYVDDVPKSVSTVVLSTQHDEGVDLEKLRLDIREKVIDPVIADWASADTKYHINPTGNFVIGGSDADAGLTGRKIIVDTYGGIGRHGGGAFSGKDPTKVDRSGAYLARYVAKNIVAKGFADRCELQIAYAIGVADPVSMSVDCFGTENISCEQILTWVRDNFSLTPKGIIEELDLLRPIYGATSAYGHFGRDFAWEKIKQ